LVIRRFSLLKDDLFNREVQEQCPTKTELVADSHHGASCRHRVCVDEKQPELIAGR